MEMQVLWYILFTRRGSVLQRSKCKWIYTPQVSTCERTDVFLYVVRWPESTQTVQ